MQSDQTPSRLTFVRLDFFAVELMRCFGTGDRQSKPAEKIIGTTLAVQQFDIFRAFDSVMHLIDAIGQYGIFKGTDVNRSSTACFSSYIYTVVSDSPSYWNSCSAVVSDCRSW